LRRRRINHVVLDDSERSLVEKKKKGVGFLAEVKELKDAGFAGKERTGLLNPRKGFGRWERLLP